MHPMEIVSGLLGGVLIGSAASGLLFFNGRIAGISGIAGGFLEAASLGGIFNMGGTAVANYVSILERIK